MNETESTDNTFALVTAAEQQGMAKWDDQKRREFASLFADRSAAARYIFLKTAQTIRTKATERRFISEHHTEKLHEIKFSVFEVEVKNYNWTHRAMPSHIGGRSVTDLDRIAEERAEKILSELPPLKAAVRVIDKVTAERMDRRDKLTARLREMKTKLEEMGGEYSMADLDQSMTIGEFRKQVKDRERKRAALSRQMDEIGADGIELTDQINKALYLGLPGLSDAVVSVVNDHIDRATAMDSTARRVGERVMFGDSEAALDLLRGFEKDEATTPAHIAAEFASAMAKLGIAAKQLKTGRTKPKKKRK